MSFDCSDETRSDSMPVAPGESNNSCSILSSRNSAGKEFIDSLIPPERVTITRRSIPINPVNGAWSMAVRINFNYSPG
jgi:hypothetical protein